MLCIISRLIFAACGDDCVDIQFAFCLSPFGANSDSLDLSFQLSHLASNSNASSNSNLNDSNLHNPHNFHNSSSANANARCAATSMHGPICPKMRPAGWPTLRIHPPWARWLDGSSQRVQQSPVTIAEPPRPIKACPCRQGCLPKVILHAPVQPVGKLQSTEWSNL